MAKQFYKKIIKEIQSYCWNVCSVDELAEKLEQDMPKFIGMLPARTKKKGSEEPTLASAYAAACNAYRDALNKMWDTDGYWIDDDMWWFDVADCVIGIAEVKELVERKVDFETFLEWYDYDTQMTYAIMRGKDVDRINLHSWLNNFPEDKKVPEKTRKRWEKEYWDNIAGEEEDRKLFFTKPLIPTVARKLAEVGMPGIFTRERLGRKTVERIASYAEAFDWLAGEGVYVSIAHRKTPYGFGWFPIVNGEMPHAVNGEEWEHSVELAIEEATKKIREKYATKTNDSDVR